MAVYLSKMAATMVGPKRREKFSFKTECIDIAEIS